MRNLPRVLCRCQFGTPRCAYSTLPHAEAPDVGDWLVNESRGRGGGGGWCHGVEKGCDAVRP
jgi:hypothetical protein